MALARLLDPLILATPGPTVPMTPERLTAEIKRLDQRSWEHEIAIMVIAGLLLLIFLVAR